MDVPVDVWAEARTLQPGEGIVLGEGPGLKALLWCWLFPRPEGLGSLRFWSGFVLSHPSEARMGHPWLWGLKHCEKQKQILHFAYPHRTVVRSGPQTRSVQDDKQKQQQQQTQVLRLRSLRDLRSG
jgi:hypothetical protein